MKQKGINKNIWYMFELLESNCATLSYEEILSDIFPQYIVETNFEKCVTTVKALHNMVKDNYARDELPSFYEFTLYHTISWWIDVVNDIPLNEIPRNLCINTQGMDMYDYLNNVDNYLDFMFQDWDFLSFRRNVFNIQEEHNMQMEMSLKLLFKH